MGSLPFGIIAILENCTIYKMYYYLYNLGHGFIYGMSLSMKCRCLWNVVVSKYTNILIFTFGQCVLQLLVQEFNKRHGSKII